jgi:hypothetical protein
MDKVTISFTLTADEAAELLVAYRAITHAGRAELTDAVREFAASLPPQMPPVAADAPAPVNAPSAAPSISSTPATASPASNGGASDMDSRGVPYHADHHAARSGATGGKNPDGTWKRRRGHDKAAADAYEAQYAGKGGGAANAAAASTSEPAPNGSASSVGFPAPPVAAAAGASTITPPPPGCPGVEEFKNRWIDLVQRNRVGREHEDYILSQWGAHPVAGEAIYAADPVKRTAVYQFMQTYL